MGRIHTEYKELAQFALQLACDDNRAAKGMIESAQPSDVVRRAGAYFDFLLAYSIPPQTGTAQAA